MRALFTHLSAFALLVAGVSSGSENSPNTPTGKTIGLVLIGRHVAMHETPGAKEECPEGFQFDSISDNWRAQFPTVAEQLEHLRRCGSRDNRGQKCENVFYSPTAVKDPLPFREVKSTIAYGMNLDGTPDGRATATTCAHKKFVSPDGEPGIDNQLYRALACERPWRSDGIYETYGNRVELQDGTAGRVLLEISGADDEQNAPSVDVTFYKGKDLLEKDSAGNVQPWLSQRIDEHLPEYIQHAHGKIVNGVLTTEPADVRFPSVLMLETGEVQLSGMRLRLAVTATGAKGLMTGYQDIDEWWALYSKAVDNIEAGYASSPPAKYEALHKLADGAKDPATGKCQALSAAYTVDWVRAFIVHPPLAANSPAKVSLR